MKFNLEDLNDLLIEGIWNWKVIEAGETIAKSNGKPQFELKCKVADKNGKTAEVKTWVPLWKLEEFCHSGGLDAEFEKKEVTARDCLKAEGKCIGKTKEGDVAPDGGKYPAKNMIVNFIVPSVMLENDFKDDDINF